MIVAIAAIKDPNKYVVLQVAPSVRASIGEAFRYPVGSPTKGKLAAAGRALGFDRVFDTVFVVPDGSATVKPVIRN